MERRELPRVGPDSHPQHRRAGLPGGDPEPPLRPARVHPF